VFVTYRAESPLLVQTGRQTEEKTLVSGFNVSRRLGFRTIVQSGVTWNTRLVDDSQTTGQWTAVDWHSWAISNSVSYQFSQRFSVGLGVDITFDDLQVGPDMETTQPYVSATWQPTDKIALSARAGTEQRRIKGSSVEDLNNPVYSASVQYSPRDTTSITIAATQSVSASYFANQAYKNSNVGLTLSQRLLRKFFLSAGVSEGRSTYIATASNVIAGRDDTYFAYHAKLATTIFRRGSIAVFFNTSRNTTNIAEFGFSSQQFGTEIGYRF
jgi:hypothetical protein